MYYQGSSEIQADGFHTLYLKNPSYVGYPDTQQQPPSNTLFSNSSAAVATAVCRAVNYPNSNSLPLAQLSQVQKFEGIPLSHHPNRTSLLLDNQQEIQASHNMISIPRFNYSLLESLEQAGTSENRTNVVQQRTKNLSLSLSPHQTWLSKPIHNDQDFRVHSSNGMVSTKLCSSPSLVATNVSSGVDTVKSVLMGSKFLKAAQELLDEVVNVGKGIKGDRPQGWKGKAKIFKDSIDKNAEASAGGGGAGGKDGGAELTTIQIQEILIKKAKLVNMSDEVEQRYRQYHHQMHIVVASFEQAAGIGSAKSYTHLALKTISKQFRCLKDAISEQIKASNKKLGEEENKGGKSESSKLKSMDHQFQQQRALQQLLMTHNNAWRPQRGLPQRAVSVLRAWLFENFLHPYPKDSDKQMLARQTGLTRSQVSNWFINARVRLWKPMVEEMYLEEMKNQQQTFSSDKKTTKTRPHHDKGTCSKFFNRQGNNSIATGIDQLKPFQFKQDKFVINQVLSPTSPSAETKLPTRTAGFSQLMMENSAEKNPKKPRNDAPDNYSPSSILSVEMETNKAGDSTKAFTTRESYLSVAAGSTSSHRPDGFGSYGIGEFGRFDAHEKFVTGLCGSNNSNTVSLTLALPSSGSSQLSAGTHQHNFFHNPARNFEGRATGNSNVNGIIPSAPRSNINGYEVLDFQNRKPFPAQLFPDFLA